MKKRLLSLFLALTFLLTAFPSGAFANEKETIDKGTDLKVESVTRNGKSYIEIPIGPISKKSTNGVYFRKIDPNTPTKDGAGQKINASAAIVWQMFDWNFPSEGFKAELKIGDGTDPRENETIAEVQVTTTSPNVDVVRQNDCQFITTAKYKVGDEKKDLKLVFDNSFRANARITAAYDSNISGIGKCYFIVVNQITMPAYTAEWYDNDNNEEPKTRPTIKGMLYSAGDEEQEINVFEKNLQYGTIGPESPRFVDENDINGNNIGMVDLVPTGSITEAQLVMTPGQKPVAYGKFLSYEGSEDTVPLGDKNGKIDAFSSTEYNKKEKKLITTDYPAYFYFLVGDNNHMWRFQMREVLNVKLNSGAGKVDTEANKDLKVNGKDFQEIGHSEMIKGNVSGREISFTTDETVVAPKVKVGNKEVDATFAGWATKPQTLTDGKLSAIEGKLVNVGGSLTDAGKTFTFTSKEPTILYAVFEAEKPGKVNIKYVNENNDDLLKADPSVKIDGLNYSKEETGIEGKLIEAALTSTSKAPKFIGYKIKSVKLQKEDQDTTDPIKYTKNGDYTVVFVYEKLDDIIPEKGDDGQPNPKATEDVKKTYIPVTWKVDSEKGGFKKGEAAVAGTEFTYYVNPTKKKTFSDVVEKSGLTPASKDENKYKIDTENPSTFNPEKVKATDEEQKPSLVVDNGTEINKLHFTVEKGLVVTVNFEQTKADQLKDKLDPETIKVWVGDTIDWKKGVKLKDANEALQKILDEDTTIVTDESNRDSSKQNLPDGKEGTLKVTFSDGSSLNVEKQTLYVADHKVPIKDGDETNKINPNNLPDDKLAVKFKLGEGVKIGTKEGNKTTPVLYETYYVKPNTGLEKSDIPTTELQDNYKNNKWYNEDAELATADYTNITAEKSFVAKATPKGQGSATVEYHVDGADITSKVENLKIDGQTYPANNKLTGTEDSVIDTAQITQPELLGYNKAGITTDPTTDAKYTEAGTAKVIFNYEKIDDIIPGEGNTKPEGYVIVKFKDTKGAKLDNAETTYYVNPMAETKAKVELVGDNYQISGTKADKSKFTANIPVVSNDGADYEVKYAEGSNDKWAYNNFDKVGKDLTTDTTFTAQVTKIGEPNVTFPDVEIEKGGSKEVTPDPRDKYGKKITDPVKPENPDKIEKPDGVTVTVDKDGKIKIEVPKDYNGPGNFTIKIPYKIDEKEITGEIKVTIKDDKKPEPKPEPKPVPEVEIPGIKYKDHKVPTYPVYAVVEKKDAEKVTPEIFTHEQYIFGYPDDTIRPDGDMTRAEAIAVVARLQKLDLSDKTSNIYKDTKAGMWYNAAINAAFREGYLLEKEGENIRPNDKITRAELALLISHIDKKNDKVAPFEDVKGHKFEAAINQAYGNERIKGYPDGTFKPDNSITRAEVATMLNKLYDRYPDKNFIDANQNLVHNYKDMSYKGHWGYYELVEAYHTHKFARLANNMEEWKAIIK